MTSERGGPVLITGGGGMLAVALEEVLRAGRTGHGVVALDRAALDVTDPAALRAALDEIRPAVVHNTAAWTSVDLAESNPGAAFDVNAEGARCVAEVCAEAHVRLVHYSTDYVFDGESETPWLPEAERAPLGVYGASKARGEELVLEVDPRALVVRTSWLYGRGGSNFVDTMVRLGRERDEVQVVADQVGAPTWTRVLAQASCELQADGAGGIWHVASRGQVSWADFARHIIARSGGRAVVRDTTTEAYGAPAPRPRYSVLDVRATEERLGRALPEWPQALYDYMREASHHPTHDPP